MERINATKIDYRKNMTAWFNNVSMHWLEMVLYRNCRESVLVQCRWLHSDYMYFLSMFIESDITYKWRNMNDNSESWHLMIAYMISISRSRQKYLQALNSAHNKYWTDLRCRTLLFYSVLQTLIDKQDWPWISGDAVHSSVFACTCIIRCAHF